MYMQINDTSGPSNQVLYLLQVVVLPRNLGLDKGATATEAVEEKGFGNSYKHSVALILPLGDLFLIQEWGKKLIVLHPGDCSLRNVYLPTKGQGAAC